MRVYDAKGTPVSDDVLIKPHSNGEMHPAVAAANILKIWIAADAAQCRREMGDLIITGTKNGMTLVINGDRHPLTKDARGRERCGSPTEKNKNLREPYWILNPGAKGSIRYLVPTGRERLSKRVDLIRRLCGDPRNAAIYGMKIK